MEVVTVCKRPQAATNKTMFLILQRSAKSIQKRSGLVTNPTMLVQFFAALAEGRIVKPESLTLMLESGWHDPEGPGYHYGFGLFVDDNGHWFSHGGKWVGYRSHVTHLVPSGITVAVQTNQDDPTDMIGLITRVAELAVASAGR